ncbi:phosphorelay protein [Sulfitobacter sp. SK012]|uniref:Hpt domain-containing protein n=1 Tax=Sulfitobacter sp. SK012 TaxID=1389005 RepID=UPI000E0C7AD3|nr:Hpt domain-containing protein [Sulfitobacter sp. SK012]AXI47993.1 phosphorelay protein [Sulfitobacter sp. SK012]
MTQLNAKELPDLAKVRGDFFGTLRTSSEQIARHALLAWDGDNVEGINVNLKAAQDTLHRIVGAANRVGLHQLGHTARQCEQAIIGHLSGPDIDLAICPGELIVELDMFVQASNDILQHDA